MSLKLAFGTVGFVLFLASFAFVSAQDTGPNSSIYCPALSQTLLFGMRDSQTNPRGQVTELQKFLSEYHDLDPEEYMTGFFGRKTRDNVRKFQCEKMNICGGTEATTGYGVVGPMTRAAIARSCGSQTTYTPPPANASCTTPWGTTLSSGSSVTAYHSSSVAAGQQCTFETRLCQNGTLTGSYQYAYCTVATTSCTPENPQTQTVLCPTGQTGSIIQTRTSTCPGPTWGAWVTTANTCITPPPPPPPPPPNPNAGSCTYKGQSYAEGQNLSISSILPGSQPFLLTCDNSVWTMSAYWGIGPQQYIGEQNACDNSPLYNTTPPEYANLGCGTYSGKALLVFEPPKHQRHGRSPLTVTARTSGSSAPYCAAYLISWGDRTTESYSATYLPCEINTSSHTYSAPGSYTISYTNAAGNSNSANIRVDPAGTASANNSSQLANALTALESALQAFLKLLGQ